MVSYYDELEIEDFTWDDEAKVYHYPCPCGDRFEISKVQLRDGEEIATCPSCSLIVRVIYDYLDYEDYETSDEDDADAEGYDTPDTTTPPTPAADKPATDKLTVDKSEADNTSWQGNGPASDAGDPSALDKAIERLDLADSPSVRRT
ncbi:hypothetical protein CspHIS471_0509690 [Cutaneotrichosporon sp. HIS471]|nr:hypothetical protein CspHIS471_0509690 [Cutaneotrichosporon sp. HIS471]